MLFIWDKIILFVFIVSIINVIFIFDDCNNGKIIFVVEIVVIVVEFNVICSIVVIIYVSKIGDIFVFLNILVIVFLILLLINICLNVLLLLIINNIILIG